MTPNEQIYNGDCLFLWEKVLDSVTANRKRKLLLESCRWNTATTKLRHVFNLSTLVGSCDTTLVGKQTPPHLQHHLADPPPPPPLPLPLSEIANEQVHNGDYPT